MGGSASYTGGGGPPMPSNNTSSLSQRMGLPGMEGSNIPMDPRVTQIMQRYNVSYPRKPTKPPEKKPTTPAKTTVPPRQFSWQFPQYSQTWAFTPPTPSKFTLPPMFDPKTLKGGTNGENTDPRTPGRQILEGLLVPHRMD